MICPKCGTEIKEGYLYCQTCGEEIIMVPDYEVELEAGIEETISEVAEIIADTVAGNDETGPDPITPEAARALGDTKPIGPLPVFETPDVAPDKGSTGILDRIMDFLSARLGNRKSLGPVLLIAAALIFLLLIGWGTHKIVTAVKAYYSFDEQYAKAQEEYKRQDYETAVNTARHVISIKPDDRGSKLLLADSYYALEKYDESIAVLEDLVREFPQDKEIYERLLKNYEKEGDTDSILRLSQQSVGTPMEAMFEEYVSDAPEFSVDSGSYFEAQTVTLTCKGNGNIYYTLDGKKPNKGSEVYKDPITVGEGETTLSAVHINEKGIESDIVSKEYVITIVSAEIPDTPKLLTEPGNYSEPKLIKLDKTGKGEIYYTSDGSDPDINSSMMYEAPILMPLGKSEFRFAAINSSGESSPIISARYNLSFSGNLDKDAAQASVQLRLIALGHPVMDHEFVSKYGYYANSRCYYVIEEYSSSNGKKVKESTLYAVDSQTGEVFTLTRNTKKGDYDFGIVM